MFVTSGADPQEGSTHTAIIQNMPCNDANGAMGTVIASFYFRQSAVTQLISHFGGGLIGQEGLHAALRPGRACTVTKKA